MSQTTLESLRKRIDLLDERLVRLLDERMELALRIRRFKAGVVDPAREQQVLDAAARRRQLISPELARELFAKIVRESVRLQSEPHQLIGFQGEHGAYGEAAIRQYAPDAVPIPLTEFADVFEAVSSGAVDLGIVPVENSIAGAVTAVDDLLLESSLWIAGEVKVSVHHCLAAWPQTRPEEVEVVYSHPMALSQCHGYLGRRKLEGRAYYDTAGAARMIATERPAGAAAIASSYAAQLYGLAVLEENIEDHASNLTRFLLLSKQRPAAFGTKCSLSFSTKHKAGALQEVLQVFSQGGTNLTRIESRPDRTRPGAFCFLLDLLGSDQDPRLAAQLEQVSKLTDGFRLLGCYPETEG